MPNNPLLPADILNYYQWSAQNGINPPQLPAGYVLATDPTTTGILALRLFDAAYITTGIIDPNRLGTGAVGAGNLYLADDGTWKAVGGGGGVGTLQQVTDLGSTTTNAINTGGVTSDYYQLDTAATPTPVQGMMFWDSDRSTVDVQLDSDVSAKIGQDNFWYVKNQSGATIPKGKAVMAVGTLGASGRILIDEMVANGSISSKFLLGITAEDIANGADGFVMNIGKLRQVNTLAWPDGTVLYCDPTTAGNLTSTKPSSPNLALPVAFVVHSAANGVLAIRVSILDENALNTPTLAQVTTAGNTTTNAITVGGLTVGSTSISQSKITIESSSRSDIILRSSGSLNDTFTIYAFGGAYGSSYAQFGTNDGVSSLAQGGAIYTDSRGGVPPIRFMVKGTGTTSMSAAMSVYTTTNVGIGTSSDAGYKLDVNGTSVFRGNITQVGGSTLTLGNGLIFDSGTGTRIFNGGTITYQSNNASLQHTFSNFVGTGLSGTIVRITNGSGEWGTTAANNFLNIAGRAAISSGTNDITSILISNEVANTGTYTGTIRGLYYNPSGISGTGFTHRAIQTVSGDVVLATTSGNVGIGTSTVPAKLTVTGSITAASLLARGVYFNNTLVAAANNDVLVGLDINPTFTNGAFTGVANAALRVQGWNWATTGVTIGPIGVAWDTSTGPVNGFTLDRSGVYGRFRIGSGSGFGYQFFTNSTERLRIVDGNVMVLNTNMLVGTTTDSGFKLDVVGADSRFNGVRVGLGAGGVSSNTVVGNGALNGNTTGSGITAVGYQAAFNNTSGGVTAIGNLALRNNTTGVRNVAVGQSALFTLTVGLDNIAVGDQTLYLTTTGNHNTAVGSGAGYSITTANHNTAIGRNSLASNSTGSSNTAIGRDALYSTTASNNTAVGYQAGYSNTSGGITAVGYRAGYNNTSGTNLTALGFESSFSNVTSTGNTSIGFQALYANTAANNTAIGDRSLTATTTGTANTAIGSLSMRSNVDGGVNVALGVSSLFSNISGNNNIAVGYQSLFSNTASNNTALGYQAGQAGVANTTGANNIFIG